MRHLLKPLLSALVSVAMVASSTAAGAAQAHQPAQPDGWMVLSMLTHSGVTTVGATGVSAAQMEAPLPPAPRYQQPPETTLLLIGSTFILAALLAFALSHGHDHH